MRRATLDIRLGRALRVGQIWTRIGTLGTWRVRQVHRVDCMVELESTVPTPSGRPLREIISFADLRKDWQQAEPIGAAA